MINTSHTAQDPAWLEMLTQVVANFIVPILIAVVTYLLVDRLGEWRKRKIYSRLGVAIIESLQEEIRNGISLMTDALNAAENNSISVLPTRLLPNKSWSGMSTIPDEVLLRIIETSAKRQFDGFPPRECRIHCKNYFEHMIQNHKQILTQTLNLAQQRQDWRGPIRSLLADDTGRYIQSARGVDQMLEHARQLLEKNAKAIFPK